MCFLEHNEERPGATALGQAAPPDERVVQDAQQDADDVAQHRRRHVREICYDDGSVRAEPGLEERAEVLPDLTGEVRRPRPGVEQEGVARVAQTASEVLELAPHVQCRDARVHTAARGDQRLVGRGEDAPRVAA